MRRNDKKTQKPKEKLENDKAKMSDILSNKEEIHDNEDSITEERDSDSYYAGDNDKEECDGIDSVEDEDEDSDDNDLEEVKIQIIVKSKNIKEPTAKILTINPVKL